MFPEQRPAAARAPLAVALATAAVLSVVPPLPAASQTIDNGLAPPEPANVLDEPDGDSPTVRNQGCRTEPLSTPCLSPPSTTVRLVEPGEVGLVRVYDSSRFEIEGGLVTWAVELYHQAHLEMTGGVVSQPGLGPSALSLRDSSTAHLAGGTLEQILFLYDQARVTMDGGEMLEVLGTGPDSRFEMWGGRVGRNLTGWLPDGIDTDGQLLFHGDASARRLSADSLQMWGGSVDEGVGVSGDGSITGGTVGGAVTAVGAAVVEIAGGQVDGDVRAADLSRVEIRGGTFGGALRALESAATIEVQGSGFAVDGVPAPDGPIAAPSGRLTGTLANGDPLDAPFEHAGANGADGTVTLLPEPGAAWLQLAGTLAVAALPRRPRRAGDRPTARPSPWGGRARGGRARRRRAARAPRP